jgi:hypothetical protein
MDLAPKYQQSACVQGTPHTPKGAASPTSWTFDLTSVAGSWGDPAKNDGVIFVPVIPKNANQSDSWQVNFKIPQDDNPQTPMDEYKDTINRVVATVAWTQPTTTTFPTFPPPTIAPTGPTGGSFGGGGGTFTGTTGTGTFTGGSPSGLSGANAPTVATTSAPAPQATGTQVPQPKLPWIVWALLPVGLLILVAMRSILLEPAVARSDGVIAAIRRRNAAARGEPLEETGDVLSQAREVTRRAKSILKRSLMRR